MTQVCPEVLDDGGDRSHRNCCIAVVVSAGYVDGFRTMVHSVRTAGRLADVPVISICRDPGLQPALVAAGADSVVVADPASLRLVDEAGRGGAMADSYLKFLAFRHLGYATNILLDCDLLCLRDARELLELDVSFAACASVMKDLEPMPDSGRSYAQSLGYAEFVAALHGSGQRWMGGRVNSGVMVIRPDDALAWRLLEIAAGGRFRHDQHCLNTCIGSLDGFPAVHYLAPRFNIVRRVVDVLGEERLDELLSGTVFLHYTGPKPWLARDRSGASPLDALWLRQETMVGRLSPTSGGQA